MSINKNTTSEPSSHMVYEFRIKGQLDTHWTEWFGSEFSAREEGGDTFLTGPVIDQAGLHGLLRKVRDLGVPLVSMICIQPGPEESMHELSEPTTRIK